MKYKIKKYRNGNPIEWNTRPQFILNPLPIEKPIEKPEDSPENIIDRSLRLMNPYEGFRSKVYDDKDPYKPYKGGKPKGTLTIGHGLTNPDIIKSFMNKEMDEQTSNNYQKEYINNDIIPALEKTSYYANLNPDQKASLISLVYNVGPTTFFKRSPKLQAALEANDWSEAVKHMDHGINQFKGLQQRRQAEQRTFMGDFVWTGNEYISKYIANPKYFKIGGKIRKHQIGQTVNWSTEPQGWKAYNEYKAKQNQIDFQNKVREANNPANNPLLNKPAPVVNQDWRNQDTYSNWQRRQRAKQAKFEQSALYKIGVSLKEGAKILSGSLGLLNIPFDIARSAGAKIPETMFTPTAFNDVDPNQSVGDFTKQIIGRGADAVSFYLGMGMIPGLLSTGYNYGSQALKYGLKNLPRQSRNYIVGRAMNKSVGQGVKHTNSGIKTPVYGQPYTASTPIAQGEYYTANRLAKATKGWDTPATKWNTKPFISEVNWANWNKSIPQNKQLMREYNAIERLTKQKGTWMKNQDGSPFIGTQPSQGTLDFFGIKMTPEEAVKAQFIQSKSANFPKGNTVQLYHGSTSPKPFYNFDATKAVRHASGHRYPDLIFGTPNKNVAKSYMLDDSGMYHLIGDLGKNKSVNYGGNLWDGVKKIWEVRSNPNLQGAWYDPFGDSIGQTKNQFKRKAAAEKYLKGLRSNPEAKYVDDMVILSDRPTLSGGEEGSAITINKLAMRYKDQGFDSFKGANILDAYNSVQPPSDSYVFFKGNNRLKSLLGNNGMFDMRNSNLFKGVLPPLVGLSIYNQNKNK